MSEFPSEIKPLIQTIQAIISQEIPDRVDDTIINVELSVMLENYNPTFEYPDVVFHVYFQLIKAEEYDFSQLPNQYRKEKFTFNVVIPPYRYNWDTQKFADESYGVDIERNLRYELHRCVVHIIKFAKTGELHIDDERSDTYEF